MPSDDVKRWGMADIVQLTHGPGEFARPRWVDASDYDAVVRENERLKDVCAYEALAKWDALNDMDSANERAEAAESALAESERRREKAEELLWQYEGVLTMMRTHGRHDKTIAGWVARLDRERDEYVQRTGRDPYHDKPGAALSARPAPGEKS